MKLTIGLIAILITAGLSMSFASHRATQAFIDGATNGFNITGIYRCENAQTPSMAVISDDVMDEMEWQLIDENGQIYEGFFIRTNDPNTYDLMYEDGYNCGSMHVSYVTKDNKGGLLLIWHEEAGELTLNKVGSVPVFIED